jgi:hypothetical protein
MYLKYIRNDTDRKSRLHAGLVAEGENGRHLSMPPAEGKPEAP